MLLFTTDNSQDQYFLSNPDVNINHVYLISLQMYKFHAYSF